MCLSIALLTLLSIARVACECVFFPVSFFYVYGSFHNVRHRHRLEWSAINNVKTQNTAKYTKTQRKYNNCSYKYILTVILPQPDLLRVAYVTQIT